MLNGFFDLARDQLFLVWFRTGVGLKPTDLRDDGSVRGQER